MTITRVFRQKLPNHGCRAEEAAFFVDATAGKEFEHRLVHIRALTKLRELSLKAGSDLIGMVP